MGDSKLSRIAPLSGIVFVVVLVVGVVVINDYGYLPAPEKIRSFFEGEHTRIGIGAYVASLSAFFLIWFAGSLRSALRRRRGS